MNEEILPPNLGVGFRHDQMIMELLMHTADGNLCTNLNSLESIGCWRYFPQTLVLDIVLRTLF
jgi:hypothetical protein